VSCLIRLRDPTGRHGGFNRPCPCRHRCPQCECRCPTVAVKQPRARLKPLDVEEITKRPEELWLADEKLRKTTSEEKRRKFIKNTNSINKRNTNQIVRSSAPMDAVRLSTMSAWRRSTVSWVNVPSSSLKRTESVTLFRPGGMPLPRYIPTN